LGDQAHAFRDKVIWKRTGRGNSLVTKESADAVDAADHARAAEGLGDTKAAVKDVAFENAVLSVVMVISNDEFWLMPCRYWKGPTIATKHFEDVKLSFQGECPQRFNVFAQDFQHVINNTKWLLNEVAAGDSDVRSKGFLFPMGEDNGTLEFRHALFEVRLISMLPKCNLTHLYLRKYHMLTLVPRRSRQ